MKKVVLSALSTLLLSSSVMSAAMADNVGYVDTQKVYKNYSKAQTLIADIKVREAELRKVQADYVKQLEENKKKNKKSPVAVDTMEKDLKQKLQTRLNEYRDWAQSQQKNLDDSVQAVIKSTAQKRNVDVVVSRQAVLLGGTDLTADVITALNK